MFKVGDRVTVKCTGEIGEVIRVRGDGVWVDTDCNMYRNWAFSEFEPLDPNRWTPRMKNRESK